MTTTGPAPGLRRQLTFEEAASLAEVKGPEIHFDYAALRLTQSPLFQRLGEKMEDDIGAQNAARMNEVERRVEHRWLPPSCRRDAERGATA